MINEFHYWIADVYNTTDQTLNVNDVIDDYPLYRSSKINDHIIVPVIF